ncbi:MAG TPA: tetratricopeptide repeat protein [Thermoanaerobaculia bacterium]
MAQATNPRIEDLRFRLKTDPKSRLFYQLAEELRRVAEYDEAEQVLRSGLEAYPSYLAAWVSLGRVLREQKKDREAVDALGRAMQLDPGNAVAARLMADAWLSLDEKVEAIKKYKLVHALLPSDESLRAIIDQIERDLAPVPVSSVTDDESTAEAGEAPLAEVIELPRAQSWSSREESPGLRLVEEDEVALEDSSEPHVSDDDAAFETPENAVAREDAYASPFGDGGLTTGEESVEAERDDAASTGDSEPMRFAHEESPFEQPVDTFTSATMEVESPAGFSVEEAPFGDENADPVSASDEMDGLEDDSYGGDLEPLAGGTSDAAYTETMADLYAKQGLLDDATTIYESILTREPGNEHVRGKLLALRPGRDPRIVKLEAWLSTVTRREDEGV